MNDACFSFVVVLSVGSANYCHCYHRQRRCVHTRMHIFPAAAFIGNLWISRSQHPKIQQEKGEKKKNYVRWTRPDQKTNAYEWGYEINSSYYMKFISTSTHKETTLDFDADSFLGHCKTIPFWYIFFNNWLQCRFAWLAWRQMYLLNEYIDFVDGGASG